MLILLGAPGSGKGTQSKLLKRYNYEILSIGEILRKITNENNELSLKIKNKINKGEFVTLDIIKNILEKYLLNDNFILDGIPRNLEQANLLDIFIKNKNWKNICCINLLVDKNLLIQRLQKRKICTKCQGSMPSETKNCIYCECDHFEKREDDKLLSVVNKRLDKFYKEIQEIKNFYQLQNSYHEIEANEDPLSVQEKILKILKLR